MSETRELNAELARGLIRYNPRSGEFTWISSRCSTTKNGEIAGCIDKTNGYRVIRILSRKYYAHRLAFLVMTGKWPSDCVDHINGDRADNRWANLREATRSQNLKNTKIRIDNKTGHRGVSWDSTHCKYKASINADGISYSVGAFERIDDAVQAIEPLRQKLFGEFERKDDGR